MCGESWGVVGMKETGARRQRRRGESYGWRDRERDAVAREQQPHRGPLKTTAGLSNGVKGHRDWSSFYPQVAVGINKLLPWRDLDIEETQRRG